MMIIESTRIIHGTSIQDRLELNRHGTDPGDRSDCSGEKRFRARLAW